ncbi:MAG: helix-turn-helix transcriptional regulator [Rubrivivax sp.]|nr:helix-turn-helix transcriptional regulator [Rubrivivax sp.]
MRTHDDVVARLMRRPAVRQEVERIERDQGALLDILLKARHVAGLSQAQVAERMGTQAPAVARLERALATGRHSPSLATLHRYAQACGKTLSVNLS